MNKETLAKYIKRLISQLDEINRSTVKIMLLSIIGEMLLVLFVTGVHGGYVDNNDW